MTMRIAESARLQNTVKPETGLFLACYPCEQHPASRNGHFSEACYSVITSIPREHPHAATNVYSTSPRYLPVAFSQLSPYKPYP